MQIRPQRAVSTSTCNFNINVQFRQQRAISTATFNLGSGVVANPDFDLPIVIDGPLPLLPLSSSARQPRQLHPPDPIIINDFFPTMNYELQTMNFFLNSFVGN